MERVALDPAALRDALGARWARVDVVDETSSTNADLVREADVPDRAALFAEHQSAGRGRLERTWVSPPRAGLIVSVALRALPPPATLGWLPLLVGVAVVEAVASAAGVATVLKWPNDVQHDEHKLAGILAQAGDSHVVVGIGLNVSTTADELPVPGATSLALCGATSLDRTALAIDLLRRIDARVAQWTDVAGDAAACGLLADYRALCTTLGREVSVAITAGGATTGRAVDVDELGRLLVDTGGTLEAVAAGDVAHLRPALP